MKILTKARPRLIYADSERNADLLYASGFMAPDPFLWFEIPGRLAGIVVSPLEYGRACKQHRQGVQVFGKNTLKQKLELAEDVQLQTAPQIIAAISSRFAVKTWLVPDDFPLGLAQRLAELAPKLKLKPEKNLFPERQLKTDSEAEFLREGVALAQAGLQAALQLLSAATINAENLLELDGRPLTAEQLQGAINCRIAALGGTAAHTIAAPGIQGADPHQAGFGPIPAHVPIVIDIFPRVGRSGYFGDLTRTVVKGTPAPLVKKAFAAVRAAQKAALELAAPGIKPAELHKAAADVLEAAGFKTDPAAEPPHGFIHGLGHGLGLEVHEEPRVAPKCEKPLQPGHVITIEPGLYYPEWGGIRLEDVVLITETGCQNLTTAEIFLELP